MKVLGKMFALKTSSLAKDSPHLFASFLKRFSDSEKEIRLYMLEFSKRYLEYHDHGAGQILEKLSDRITDTQNAVIRRQACVMICEIAEQNPDIIPDKLIGNNTILDLKSCLFVLSCYFSSLMFWKLFCRPICFYKSP